VGNALATRLSWALGGETVRVRAYEESVGYYRFDWNERWIALMKRARNLILPVPMWNMGIPASLKDFLDRVSRRDGLWALDAAGRRCGLLAGASVTGYEIMTSRDVCPEGDPRDFVVPYLRAVLGSFGVDRVLDFRVGDVRHSPGLVADKRFMAERTRAMLDRFGLEGALYRTGRAGGGTG
jgi:FMN-dependent NADH-azoreductase